jgi:hypothetical protein
MTTDQTPAGELRAAAQRLRDVAEEAAKIWPAPWRLDDGEVLDAEDDAIWVSGSAGPLIAAMHPGVALALAEVLEAEADGIEMVAAVDNRIGLSGGARSALTLARLVLEAR